MKPAHIIVNATTNYPKSVLTAIALGTVVMLSLIVLPMLFPQTFTALPRVEIDTDPENMLDQNEPVRVFHNDMKALLSLNDIMVVGVVNTVHPNGVFNKESLARIYELTEYALTLHGEAIGETDPNAGVIGIDVIAPSTVDNIEQGGIGVVKFEWLMPTPPETDDAALAIRDKALRLSFLNGTLVSEDGKAIALYLPLSSKDLSYKISSLLARKVDEFTGDDEFHITGLPVAEDTFGVEMFKQMALTAPAAMLVIFLLMLFFFRKFVLVISPMLVAIASVIVTMGLLIVTGNTIHIMSSMIPIFIMPIAVLDSVHILSEFFDRYQETRDRRKTIVLVMDDLFVPMLFTSLTSAAGFASLALTPIPPVRVFGIFVATGVLAAWMLTIVLVPAYIMLIPERSFKNFGLKAGQSKDQPHKHRLSEKALAFMGRTTIMQSAAILWGSLLLVVVAGYGISKIQINDNPTRWFKPSHPIRVADRVLNEHFGGTYMGYLAFTAPENTETLSEYTAGLRERMTERANALQDDTPEATAVLPMLKAQIDVLVDTSRSSDQLLDELAAFIEERIDQSDDDLIYGWEEFGYLLDEEKQRGEIFKQPEALNYLSEVQQHLLGTGVVGKSNSLSDIVKTVHRALLEGAPEEYRIPDSKRAVAQCLITFESGHRPHDLFHFVTPDYKTTNIWVQLKSGDNRDMAAVVEALETFTNEHPPPFGIQPKWFGLTYINVVWQDKMVSGMLQAFMGSFLVVLLMMVVLFRSGLWGLLSMIPLTVTIGLIYGVIGLIGKDYDMPVAVLSSLTLGLAVDFAIHFLARSRSLYAKTGSFEKTITELFGEPARAITRNVVVIAVGFLPLIAATLMPYRTVGVFLASILLLSGAGTLVLLPALMRYLHPWLFPETDRHRNFARRATVIVGGESAVGLIIVNIHQYTDYSAWMLGGMALASLLALVGLSIVAIRAPKQASGTTQ